jgi:putative DNA primase/helicase
VNWRNYDDVLAQMKGWGLLVDTIGSDDVGKRRRVRVEGDKERRGWYMLHELELRTGGTALVGTFGVWRGNDPGTQKVELRKIEVSDEQREALAMRIKADQAREKARRQAEGERASRAAADMWGRLDTQGECEYLQRKGVQAYGVRFSKRGAMAIAMMDTSGVVHGLQLIYPKGHERAKRLGRDKDFWPAGLQKQGHFAMIGAPTAHGVLLIGEGYATCATLHEATGLPVAVAFDAGNLLHVAKALAKRYSGTKLLLCADDDHVGKCRACGAYTPVAEPTCQACGQEHHARNAGREGAKAAALAVGGEVLLPHFPWERPTDAKGDTDFNDLACGAFSVGQIGTALVRDQVETHLSAIGWTDKAKGGAKPRASAPPQVGGEGGADDDLGLITDLAQMEERFAIVYEMGDTVFDGQEHKLVPMVGVRNLCMSRDIHKRWMESPQKRVTRLDEVGFDPSGMDPKVKCNLWNKWPTTPVAGDCSKLLQLGEYLCSNDARGPEIWQWVLKWLAYPVQHPGAKMQTALVIHGPQGTGKNMFMEAHMSLYGEYGRVVGQDALEDKFNDTFSRKLFIIADEVVNRHDLYTLKNKLKDLVTGYEIRINPKNVGAYFERNHLNVVFQSNEAHPMALERDDRRFCVIYTPDKLDEAFYHQVAAEIANGGREAWHDYLLHLDLGDFGPATKPPMTQAKRDLIELGLDSTERFYIEWIEGRLGLPVTPARTEDVYKYYRHDCQTNGVAKPAQMSTMVGALSKRPGVRKARERHWKNHSRTVDAQSMVLYPPGAETNLSREELSDALANFAVAVEKLVNPKRGLGGGHAGDDEGF